MALYRLGHWTNMDCMRPRDFVLCGLQRGSQHPDSISRGPRSRARENTRYPLGLEVLEEGVSRDS